MKGRMFSLASILGHHVEHEADKSQSYSFLPDMDMEMEDEASFDIRPRPVMQQEAKAQALAQEELVFCRCGKNIYRHMTVQGTKPKPFDLLLQTYKEKGFQSSSEGDHSVRHIAACDEHTACLLGDSTATQLIENIALWQVESVQMQIRPTVAMNIGTEAESLLLEMAGANAFKSSSVVKGSGGNPAPARPFYNPPNEKAAEIKTLHEKGLIIPDPTYGADDSDLQRQCKPEYFWVSDLAVSRLTMMQQIGSKQSLGDFPKMLGLGLYVMCTVKGRVLGEVKWRYMIMILMNYN